tara:strand:+ start:332 stop:676 length:345 start_codon:yes stop_codon:yes gene_type:complete
MADSKIQSLIMRAQISPSSPSTCNIITFFILLLVLPSSSLSQPTGGESDNAHFLDGDANRDSYIIERIRHDKREDPDGGGWSEVGAGKVRLRMRAGGVQAFVEGDTGREVIVYM